MTKFKFLATVRQQLREVLKKASTSRQLRRAQGLLWIADGDSSKTAAARLGVSRQTVYNWIRNLLMRRPARVADRLQDRPRSGRPRSASEMVEAAFRQVWSRSPQDFGFHSPAWTTPLLRRYIRRKYGVTISTRTIRRTLRRLNYRYKRPKHVYSRRSPTWGQAKGGFSAA